MCLCMMQMVRLTNVALGSNEIATIIKKQRKKKKTNSENSAANLEKSSKCGFYQLVRRARNKRNKTKQKREG